MIKLALLDYDKIGLKFWVDFLSKKRLNFYIGTGFYRGFTNGHYSIEGEYQNKKPSNRMEKLQRNLLRFDLGAKIKLYQNNIIKKLK